MDENPEPRTDRAPGTLWNLAWPLLFLCAMTVLSMATQNRSGYVQPQTSFAQRSAQPSQTTAQ